MDDKSEEFVKWLIESTERCSDEAKGKFVEALKSQPEKVLMEIDQYLVYWMLGFCLSQRVYPAQLEKVTPEMLLEVYKKHYEKELAVIPQ